jgi:hypothetical protein
MSENNYPPANTKEGVCGCSLYFLYTGGNIEGKEGAKREEKHKNKRTNNQMEELPTECWRVVLNYTGLWGLGQLLKTCPYFRTACAEHFSKNKSLYFSIAYSTEYNVATWAVVQKHFASILAARPAQGPIFQTLHGVVGYLYANRIYVYKDSFVYVPESNDPYLEGPLTMQVYVDDSDEEEETWSPCKIRAPETMPPISGSTIEALALWESPAW